MNLPIAEEILAHHDKDLYLFYSWLNLAYENSNFSSSADAKVFRAYKRKDLSSSELKQGLREQTGISSMATLNKYLKSYAAWQNSVLGQTGILVIESCGSAMVFLDYRKFIEIQAALERDWSTYAERNRVIRVLFYMILQCYRFEDFTRSQENLARDIGMQKQQLVAALDYIISQDWIRISKEAYYDASRSTGNRCHARYYKLVADLIPPYMRGFAWINQRLAEPK